MIYYYQAYKIPIKSTVKLSHLISLEGVFEEQYLSVEIGEMPKVFNTPMEVQNDFSHLSAKYNPNEYYLEIKGVAKYYTLNGNKVIIEPNSDNMDEILTYFYSNCLAAVLFQRNILPFHVSGVFIDERRVALFAAPSKTGKSTIATKLRELGYRIFTDDTAILTVRDQKCYALASYPVTRLWQSSIVNQMHFEEEGKFKLLIHEDKFGFNFTEDFSSEAFEVSAVIFLDIECDNITIQPVNPLLGMQLLYLNIYRKNWVEGMRKQSLVFRQLTSLIDKVQLYRATRPKDIPTFDSFAEQISKEILKKI